MFRVGGDDAAAGASLSPVVNVGPLLSAQLNVQEWAEMHSESGAAAGGWVYDGGVFGSSSVDVVREKGQEGSLVVVLVKAEAEASDEEEEEGEEEEGGEGGRAEDILGPYAKEIVSVQWEEQEADLVASIDLALSFVFDDDDQGEEEEGEGGGDITAGSSDTPGLASASASASALASGGRPRLTDDMLFQEEE